jgi:hypothetical protein
MTTLSHFIANIVTYIIQPIIVLLFAAALFLFVNGATLFFDVRGSDPKERDRGKKLLLWGVAGFFIMTFGMSIIAAVTNTFCGTPFCKTVNTSSAPATVTIPTSTLN